MSIESFIEFGKAAEKVATALGDLSQALDVVSRTPCFTTPLWKENPSVMISIKPQYCELIASGRKTIEIRKTRPKIETPFKCYIYCTEEELLTKSHINGNIYVAAHKEYQQLLERNGNLTLSGKVIGEFICNNIVKFPIDKKSNNIALTNMQILSCLGYEQIKQYAKGNYYLYGWHISDFVIYDKPKELREFRKPCQKTNLCYPDNCNRCGWNILLRPPQSWFYIEALEDT